MKVGGVNLRGFAAVVGRIVRSVRERALVATDPAGYARRIGVRVGQDCLLVGVNRSTFGSEPYLISIGDHVAVAAGVRFITHDGGAWVLKNCPDLDVVGRIEIHDNVFIGVGAVLLPGIEIGPDAVVAAGAVVSRTVQPGVVVAGVPAKPLCTLAEYEAKALSRGMHVRNLPIEEKKRLIQQRFPGPGENASPSVAPGDPWKT